MATQYLFFSGKGGVGKTTMACATAASEADKGRRTLIVTTDPASNLADVFEQPIGHQVTAIEGVERLWAMEIDPDKATEEYRDQVLAPFRAVMPGDVMSVLEEQFRSPCTTEIASFDRFVDFMDEDRFDVVVFDTAPTGHTLRLLELLPLLDREIRGLSTIEEVSRLLFGVAAADHARSVGEGADA